MRKARQVIALVIGCGMVAGCATAPSPPPSQSRPPAPSATATPRPSPSPAGLTISGTYILSHGVVRRDETGCHGTGEYAEVGTGGAVAVRDYSSGALLGSVTLADDPSGPRRGTVAEYLECSFQFTISGIPDHPVYQIELPGFGSIEYGRDELRQLASQMTFSVGGPAPDLPGIPGLTLSGSRTRSA